MDVSKVVFRCGVSPAEGRTPQRSRCGRLAVFLLLGGVLAALMLWTAGCADEASKKAALTDEEIERLTFAPKPTRPDELVVSGEPLSCEDVIADPPDRAASGDSFQKRLEALAAATTLEQFLEMARPQARRQLDSRITNIVLYKRAKRELGEKVDETLDDVTEKELRRFVLEHGGNNAQADEALRALGMNRSTFKEFKKKQMLAQYAVSSKLPKARPFTYSELVAAYDEMKDQVFIRPAMIQFRLIDIEATKIELTDPNDDPVQAARTLAEQLVTRVIAGEDFGKLAEEYSHGYRKAYGGLWTPRDPESLAEPYRVLPGVAEKIEVGQIAGPIDVPGHAFVMKLEQRRPKGHYALAEVQEQVEEKIRTDRRVAALQRLDAEVAEQSAVANTDQFLDHCLERLYRTVRPSTP